MLCSSSHLAPMWRGETTERVVAPQGRMELNISAVMREELSGLHLIAQKKKLSFPVITGAGGEGEFGFMSL